MIHLAEVNATNIERFHIYYIDVDAEADFVTTHEESIYNFILQKIVRSTFNIVDHQYHAKFSPIDDPSKEIDVYWLHEFLLKGNYSYYEKT